MNIASIVEFLEENRLSEVTEVTVNDDMCVVEFFYDFDKDEIEAAKAYANEESDLEEESEEWRTDYYIPYLLDLAKDSTESIIEDVCEELELEGKATELDIDANTLDYIKFKAIFCIEEFEGDLEEVLNDYL